MGDFIHAVDNVVAFLLIVAVLCLVLDTRALVREHLKRMRKGW